jgi:hypothetical protein
MTLQHLDIGKVYIALIGGKPVVGSFVPSGWGMEFMPAINTTELEAQAREEVSVHLTNTSMALSFYSCSPALAARASFSRAWDGVLFPYGVLDQQGNVITKEAAIELAKQSIGQEVMGYYPGEVWVITGYDVRGDEKRGKIVAQAANREVWRALQDIQKH